MSRCPDCAEPIGDWDLARAVLPVWVACPSCRATLVGSRFVQVASAAMALVAGLILLVSLFLLQFQGPSSVATLLAVAALPLLVTWLIGLLLIKRFGSYVSRESLPGAHPLVRRYLLVAGLLSIALVAVAVLYADYTVRTGVLATLALAAFLLLYPWYEGRLGDRVRKAATVVLLVWAGMIVALAAVLTPFGVINFPKEGAFEEQLALEPRPQSEHDAWDELVALTRNEGANEEALLEFFAQNVVSVPNSYSYRTEVPRVVRLAGIATSELEKVTELLERGDGPAANDRYLRLWTAADNMVTGNGALIQHLVGLGVVGALISYYLDGNSEALRPSVQEIEGLSASIESKLEDSFANGMVAEYVTVRNTLLEFRGRSGCVFLIDEGLRSCQWDVGWPFYDEHKTMREVHYFYFKTIELSRQPFFATDRDPAFADLEARCGAEYSVGDIWTNPFGTGLLRVVTPLISRFSSSTDFTRAKLSAFRFALEATATGNLGDPPIDPLTRKPFIVTRTGDTVEISSARTTWPSVSLELRMDSP